MENTGALAEAKPPRACPAAGVAVKVWLAVGLELKVGLIENVMVIVDDGVLVRVALAEGVSVRVFIDVGLIDGDVLLVSDGMGVADMVNDGVTVGVGLMVNVCVMVKLKRGVGVAVPGACVLV
jgi:hypothetical protein